jgi:hypothetical protein
VDTASLGVKYRQMESFPGDLTPALQAYRAKWMQQLGKG